MNRRTAQVPRRAAGAFSAAGHFLPIPAGLCPAVLLALLLLFRAFPARAAEPPEPPALVLSGSDGTRLFSAAARPGDRFSIVFTHSLMLSRVEEVFEALPDGRFRLVETRYKDFGAGLPHEELPGQTMRFENGEIILDGYTAVFPHVWLRVGHVADHRLVAPSGETVHLNTLARPGAAVKMSIAVALEGNDD